MTSNANDDYTAALVAFYLAFAAAYNHSPTFRVCAGPALLRAFLLVQERGQCLIDQSSGRGAPDPPDPT